MIQLKRPLKPIELTDKIAQELTQKYEIPHLKILYFLMVNNAFF